MPHTESPWKDVTLFHFPATRSARVRWLLEELGMAHTVRTVDLFGGEGYSPEFLRLNPNHAVPVLQFQVSDTGERVTMLESAAMLLYIADAVHILTDDEHGGPRKLAPLPGPSAERADYLQQVQFALGWIDLALWVIRTNEHLLPPELKAQSQADYYRAKFRVEMAPQLEARLQDREYICGNQFSAADIALGHTLFWAAGYGMLQEHPILQKYLRGLMKRPAFKRAFSDAGEMNITKTLETKAQPKFTQELVSKL